MADDYQSVSMTKPEDYMEDVRAIFQNAKAGKDRMSVELAFSEE